MLEYWMANNDTSSNGSESEIKGLLEDPGSAVLFAGYPSWLLYFAAGCCILFMLIGIPGNLITIAALFRTKKLRNATAVFIMNLSVSDLMFCCFNLPLATSTFWHGSWLHGTLLCRLFPLLRYGLVAVSLFTVLAITINRYVMIGHPRLYPKLYKPKYLVLMVLATWISGFGALVATWFERWGRFGLDPAIGSCSILPDVNDRSPKEFLFILAFLTPCIAIIVCYARIFYIVRKTALKSRRRDKVTTDLVKASLEVKYTKNYEDSAIGSSCGATLTTTENGGSPTKHHAKNFKTSSPGTTDVHRNYRGTSQSKHHNHCQPADQTSRRLSSVQSSRSDDNPIDGNSVADRSSLNDANSSRRNSGRSDSIGKFSCRVDEPVESGAKNSPPIRIGDSVGNEETRRSTIPYLQVQGEKMRFEESEENSRLTSSSSSSDEDEEDDDEVDRRTNFERSVEFLPFIDTQTDPISRDVDDDDDSAFGNSENPVARSIPNLRFFDAADAPIAKKSVADRQTDFFPADRPVGNDGCCLRVPDRYPRLENSSADRSVTRNDSTSRESKRQQILNTKSLEDNGNGSGNGVTLANRFLADFERNSELLSPQSARYTAEMSDEYVSSRSDSPTDRRGSTRRTNVFRRESRFRSVRNRAFESGKMTTKDKKLLKMILVIFSSFLVCYLPITITKTFKDVIDWRGLNIAGYILIYLTTCINPVIYVVMSSEYRCAYKNVLLCRSDSSASNCKQQQANQGENGQEKRRRMRERKRTSD